MKPLFSVEVCLKCGRPGTHRHVAYASSRGMIEKGKVCRDCWRGLMEEKQRPRFHVWRADAK